MSSRRWLITVLSFLAAIGASVWIIRSSWSADGARVSLPLWTHAAALSAAAFETLFRAVKIHWGARALGIRLSVRTCIRVILGGDFGAAITPARSGAEPARFLVLSEAGVPVAGSIIVLFTEIVLEMLSLAAVAVALGFLLDGSGAMAGGLAGLVGGYTAFIIGAGVGGYALSKRNASGPPPRWARRVGLHAGRWRTVQRSLRQLRGSMDSLRRASWWMMFLSFLFSILHVLARLAILPIIMIGLGASIDLAPLVLWPMAILYGGAVAPAPGGGGLIEVAFRAALDGHIPVALMGAALLWWRVYTFYVLLVAGGLVAGNLVLRALRKGDEEADDPAAAAAAAVASDAADAADARRDAEPLEESTGRA